jgi:hypothetical protein
MNGVNALKYFVFLIFFNNLLPDAALAGAPAKAVRM